MRNLGLASFFSVVVTRNDVCRIKPDPIMTNVAISRIRVPFGWLVGDTVYDSEADTSAGLRSINVRRDGIRPSFKHDCFFNSLIDVAAIVLGVLKSASMTFASERSN